MTLFYKGYFSWDCCFCCLLAKSCPTLCEPLDCSPPGSSVHGIFLAGILERVAVSFSRVSSWPKDQTHISCFGRQVPYHWATSKEALAEMVNRILKLLLTFFFCIMYDTESVFSSKLEQTYTNFCPTVVLWDNKIMGNWGWRRFLAILKVNPFLLLVCIHDVWPETRQDFISVIYVFFLFLFFFFCSEFCHTLEWNSHGFTCVPHPNETRQDFISVIYLFYNEAETGKQRS